MSQGIMWNHRAASRRTKKRTLRTVKGHFLVVANTKVHLFKDHFWHFQIKIKFFKKS